MASPSFVALVDRDELAGWNRGIAKARAAYEREHSQETEYERKLRIAANNRRTQQRRRKAGRAA